MFGLSNQWLPMLSKQVFSHFPLKLLLLATVKDLIQ